MNPNWSRRKFIAAIAGAGTGMMLSPALSWAVATDLDPRVAAIVAGSIGVDTHNHIDVPLTAAGLPGPDIDLASQMKRSGLSAICMTFAVDYQQLRNPGEAYERFKNGLAAMDTQLQKNGMQRALNMAQLHAAHQRHPATVIQSVEGGHFLEGRPERRGEAYDRGLRHLTLLHDSDASVPLGDVYTNPPRYGGLTDFGTQIVKECNRLGILIDLTHCNTQAVAAALKLSDRPVMISHTGLDTQLGQNPNMAQMMRPRLISKDEAKLVASAGGVIGVWTHLSDSPLAYAQNIRAMIDVVGIDHVCIGTDTKLTQPYRPVNFGPKPNDAAPHPDGPPPGNTPPGANDNRHNDSAPGANNGRIGERTNEAWAGQTQGFYYVVVDALLKTGFAPNEIAKIGGDNFCRIFDAATAKN